MFERPTLHVFAKSVIKSFFAQNLFPQYFQAHGGFVISLIAQISSGNGVGNGHNGVGIGFKQRFRSLVHVSFGRQIFAIIKVFFRQSIDKCVKTFVHPSKFALVAAHNHRKPIMPKFVACDAKKVSVFGLIKAENDARIFHAVLWSRNIHGNWIGVFIDVF